MTVRLSERLNIDESQKTEITSMLFTFLKDVQDKNVKTDSISIVNHWLKYVKKPRWMREKIDKDIGFIAGVCEFVEQYKEEIINHDINESNIVYI